ncbi:shikimate kinase [Priestia flexa]|uniref:shikimate kinase n=1 Tax=Priestia flexa TaxID=86664 RepID=UPI000953E590|nr:shikimate kinase [Priestia flexa]MBY6086073.1 shikimate kinase [Priestia flexa]WHX79914.1 shikimate kinase [Priestia flexa]SIQ28674.1 shikimate kinase [Priestia flexa]
MDQTIVLVGFMGVGKTTIGQALARKLDFQFIDTDQRIEAEMGMQTTDIFRVHGEAFFRQKEKETITQLVKKKKTVLSLGGGAFLQAAIRDTCLQNGIVICLSLSFDGWKERLDDLLPTRPVLQGKSLVEIEELFYNRQAIYQSHHKKVVTDALTPEEVADEIIEFVLKKN